MDLDFGTDTAQKLAELRAIVRRYQDRYGELSGMTDLAKANAVLATRQRRFDQLSKEYERIGKQMRAMRSEVERIEHWMEFCLEDVIERARRDHREGWSPAPVFGFRLWAVGEDGMYGAKMLWLGRKMTATCLTTKSSYEIPHTDGRCGRLGCGVYAAKKVDPLFTEFDIAAIGDVAIGLVALTGKVVEHDSGYRGAEAEVVALGASLGDHLLLTADPDRIEAVFADPMLIRAEPVVEFDRQRLLEMETFMEIQARRASGWISETNNE